MAEGSSYIDVAVSGETSQKSAADSTSGSIYGNTSTGAFITSTGGNGSMTTILIIVAIVAAVMLYNANRS